VSDQSARNVPYLGEYLSRVLKPRVEEALGPVEEWLNQVVWDKLVRVINEQQPGEIPKDELLKLLKQELGLRLMVGVESEYSEGSRTTEASRATSESSPSNGAPHVTEARRVEKIEVKRRAGGRPLVDAVLRKDDQ